MARPGPARRAAGRACIVLTTGADRAAMRRIAATLLRERLAACIQEVPIASAYRWKGKIVRDREVLLLIKTRAALYRRVETRIRSLHSYTVPEILRVPVTGGVAGYLAWLGRETI